MPRPDGRANDELRPTTIETNFQKYAEGSALVATQLAEVITAREGALQ